MTQEERPLMDRIWEFTKDLSVKVSRQAEKHWKINTLRVEIASIRHRVNVKFKELGKFVYEALNSQNLEESAYKDTLSEFLDEIKRLETEIQTREHRIAVLEEEMDADKEVPAAAPSTATPPIPVAPRASGDSFSQTEDPSDSIFSSDGGLSEDDDDDEFENQATAGGDNRGAKGGKTAKTGAGSTTTAAKPKVTPKPKPKPKPKPGPKPKAGGAGDPAKG